MREGAEARVQDGALGVAVDGGGGGLEDEGLVGVAGEEDDGEVAWGGLEARLEELWW